MDTKESANNQCRKKPSSMGLSFRLDNCTERIRWWGSCTRGENYTNRKKKHNLFTVTENPSNPHGGSDMGLLWIRTGVKNVRGMHGIGIDKTTEYFHSSVVKLDPEWPTKYNIFWREIQTILRSSARFECVQTINLTNKTYWFVYH